MENGCVEELFKLFVFGEDDRGFLGKGKEVGNLFYGFGGGVFLA